ncbi:MAG: energy transducer TonB [Bacteroidota bacterium]
MKSRKQFSAFLWLVTFLFLVSCSKQETSTPPQLQKSVTKNIPALIDSRSQYELLDQFPSFPGGDSLFMEYLKTHIEYSSSSAQNDTRGKVFASFIVENDGSISNVAILKGIGYGCDEQVAKVLRNMPAWQAGRIGTENVRVKLVIPVEFKK